MLYCSIDIETTGLNPETCDIIQFAAVIDDLSNPLPLDKLPRLQVYFVQPTYSGEPYALSLHSEIFKKIEKEGRKGYSIDNCEERFMTIKELPLSFKYFLTKNGFKENEYRKVNVTVAGKNAASFDLPFLKNKIEKWRGIVFEHRIIDPAILYYSLGDQVLPNSKLCMERAGIKDEVAHTALEDALMVVKLIRHKLIKKDI